MGALSLILLVPLAWPFFAKALWKHEITLPELAVNLVVGVSISIGGYMASRYVQAHDVEIHNGALVSKDSQTVLCEHSYECRCREVCSGSGDKKSCRRECDTCYEHTHDVDWNLRTDIGAIKIDRVDRQGLKQPPRFSRAMPGDPVSLARSYQNYIKAAPDSLFNASVQQFLVQKFYGRLPKYPATVFDYHYVNRVLAQGASVPDLQAWNDALSKVLSRLGPRKEVNVVIVIAEEADPQYAEALRAAWLGGKKNDVVVVLGTPAYPKLEWVRIFSWSDSELFKVQLRDELLALGQVEREPVLKLIDEHVSTQFVRKSIEDFAYLKNEAVPPAWLVALLMAISATASIGLSIFLSKNTIKTRSPR